MMPLRPTPRSQPRRPAWGRHGRGSIPLLGRFLSQPQPRLSGNLQSQPRVPTGFLNFGTAALVSAACCRGDRCWLVTEPGDARAPAVPLQAHFAEVWCLYGMGTHTFSTRAARFQCTTTAVMLQPPCRYGRGSTARTVCCGHAAAADVLPLRARSCCGLCASADIATVPLRERCRGVPDSAAGMVPLRAWNLA